MKMGKRIGILALLVFVLSMSLSLGFAAQASAAEPIKILCFGDSNTYGWMPVENTPTTRYPQDVRWTGILQKELGNKFKILEEGLNGRTAGLDEFTNGLDQSVAKDLNLNGRPHLLPILKSQLPVDVVVIMLGTNDTKYYFEQTPEQIAQSMKNLVNIVNRSAMNKEGEWLAYKAPKVLVVSPAPVRQGKSAGLNTLFTEKSDAVSQQLAPLYAQVAKETGAEFFDAATVIPAADGMDGIHLSADAHKKLGKALAKKIAGMVKK